MSTPLLIVALGVVAVLAVFAGVLVAASRRPGRFEIRRSALIAASPAEIHPLIDDLHRWLDWSPFEKKDPAMQRWFSGAARGPGAVYDFAGNKSVGEGRCTVTESVAPSRVALTLEMYKPFRGMNDVLFTLAPERDGTRVTWIMTGDAPLPVKVMGMLFDMDGMVGRDFERGLEDLKSLVEREVPTLAALA